MHLWVLTSCSQTSFVLFQSFTDVQSTSLACSTKMSWAIPHQWHSGNCLAKWPPPYSFSLMGSQDSKPWWFYSSGEENKLKKNTYICNIQSYINWILDFQIDLVFPYLVLKHLLNIISPVKKEIVKKWLICSIFFASTGLVFLYLKVI